MIIHPAGTTTTHRIYLNWIKGLQDKIRSSLTDKNSDEFKNHLKKNNIKIITWKDLKKLI